MKPTYEQGKIGSPLMLRAPRTRGLESNDITNPRDPRSNPKHYVFHYHQDGIAPHGITKRWEYIVPPLRRAVVESILAEIIRMTVAAPPALYAAEVYVTRAKGYGFNFGGGFNTNHLRIKSMDNNAGFSARATQFPIELLEGDIYNAFTIDQSTGGTVAFLIGANITEYDAIPFLTRR